MAKEISAFLRAESGDDATTQEPQNRTFGRLAKMRLEFAEGGLDWVEVRRILRKVNQRRRDKRPQELHPLELANEGLGNAV
jgi:hypothetical protein